MNLNIDYEKAIDFGHIEDINKACIKLSELTNLLNRILIIRQKTKKDIIEACSKFPEENFHKLSWENKLLRLASISGSSELINLWQEADAAYRQVKHKLDQVFEDINCLKKQIDITPR